MKTLKMVLSILFLSAMLVACGGGGNNPPVYNDQGECVANCPEDVVGGDNLPDAVMDTTLDGMTDDSVKQDNPLPDASGDQYTPDEDDASEADMGPDMGEFTCPAEEPANICKPKEALEAYCWLGEGPHVCVKGFYENQPCASDVECQEVPVAQLPPCVCWDVCWVNYEDQYGRWFCNPDNPPSDGNWKDGEIVLQDAGAYCGINFLEEEVFYHAPGEDWNVFQTPAAGAAERKLSRVDGNGKLEVTDGAGNHLLWCWYADDGQPPDVW